MVHVTLEASTEKELKEKLKDYSEIYLTKLDWLTDKSIFGFDGKDLFERLPKLLPSSIYHGDLTLENIIFLFVGLIKI